MTQRLSASRAQTACVIFVFGFRIEWPSSRIMRYIDEEHQYLPRSEGSRPYLPFDLKQGLLGFLFLSGRLLLRIFVFTSDGLICGKHDIILCKFLGTQLRSSSSIITAVSQSVFFAVVMNLLLPIREDWERDDWVMKEVSKLDCIDPARMNWPTSVALEKSLGTSAFVASIRHSIVRVFPYKR